MKIENNQERKSESSHRLKTISESQRVNSGLGTLVSPQGLCDCSLGALGGLTGHRAHRPPLVCREPQGAAPAVEAVLLQHPGAPALLPAAAAAAAVHLPGQTPA
ncbi:hypothetical protein GOODEAATRI_031866 [Goodea atripinnis]|uniref:Uncharacterized protein n=1 Tax=Goodea atripinnis TaxID=208336 RepID=A0ABV0NFC5_9TELE